LAEISEEVRREVVRRFVAAEVDGVLDVLGKMSRPAASSPEWLRERLRVHMAVILLSAGDVDRLLGEVARAEISMSTCPHCDGAAQEAYGELVEVSPEVADMVKCDAQHVSTVTDAHGGVVKRATQNIPPAAASSRRS
jgi:hypothetical protein